VPIDGDQLTRLMIRHGVGCRIEETLYIKKVDEEFFDRAVNLSCVKRWNAR
jgi:restriction system protein